MPLRGPAALHRELSPRALLLVAEVCLGVGSEIVI